MLLEEEQEDQLMGRDGRNEKEKNSEEVGQILAPLKELANGRLP